MPKNKKFWIFPNNNIIHVTYNRQNRDPNLFSNILSLFSTPIVAVNTTTPVVHPEEYYTDDTQHHALNQAWGAIETNVEHLLHTRSPIQGRGTSIIINGLTVYHETATYKRRNFDGICTLFYTFHTQTQTISVHAIGAHSEDGYYLDCASQEFDAAVRKLGNKQWGYEEIGILKLH